jgi:hypothetical protein
VINIDPDLGQRLGCDLLMVLFDEASQRLDAFAFPLPCPKSRIACRR